MLKRNVVRKMFIGIIITFFFQFERVAANNSILLAFHSFESMKLIVNRFHHSIGGFANLMLMLCH